MLNKWKEVEIGKIPSYWDYLPFGNTLSEPTRNGIYKPKEFHGRGVKIVNMGEIFAYDRLPIIEMQRIELTEEEIKKSCLMNGDLLFARRSLIAEGAGKCTLVLEQGEPVTFESSIIRARPDKNKADSRYIYYLFKSKIGRYLLGTILRQVAVAGITGSDLVDIKIPLPPLKEQNYISNILELFDNKIDLLRKQNKTLENIAQALFKHWFVDFDFPNEEGKPYKSSGGKMFESELGEVPNGWRISTIDEIIGTLETGKRPRGGVANILEGVPSIGAESITNIGEFDISKTKYVPEDFYAEMKTGKVKNRDIMVYKDGGAPGTFIPHISMFGEEFPFEKACINEHVFLLRSSLDFLHNFLFFYLNSYLCIEEMKIKGTGAAIPGINSTELKSLTLVKPDDKIIKIFDKTVEPIVKQILRNSKQSLNLSNIRDTFLPKLMSGQIRIKENTSNQEVN